MSNLKKVAVVIPFYRSTISEYESIALQQCEKILGAYPRIAIKPQSLTLPANAHPETYTNVISFNDSFFEGIAGYNSLMLSSEFYQQFLAYEYILIYQLDAFVFKDELNYWCNQGFDYVGAPWLRDTAYGDWVKAIKSKFQNRYHTRNDVYINGEPSPKQFENKVGNGGFSLRRVQKFLNVTLHRQQDIQKYLSEKDKHQFNEDAFWSIEVNRKIKVLNIPDHKKGVSFAFENSLQRALELNGGQLPFGCHAWDRHIHFWMPYFELQGYKLLQLQLPEAYNPAKTAVDIKYLYRISDGGNPKRKLNAATKMNCLDNFIREFKHNLYVFADNCKESTIAEIENRGINPIKTSLGNAQSWRYIVQCAIENFDEDTFVYLIEDDYLHLPGSLTALQEGLQIADYVTLYDHPDKYLNYPNDGPNPYVSEGGEWGLVLLTKSTHWKHTNSTTMSFAVRVKTIKADLAVWWRNTQTNIPADSSAFWTLTQQPSLSKPKFKKKIQEKFKAQLSADNKRILICSIPGFATHAELDYLSPLTQWHPIQSWEDA